MKIKPYEKNAKKHPKKQLNQLAKVVKEVGWRQPVVVNQHGVIVVGHGRWETYEKNKESLKEIWVIDDTGKTIMGAPETMPLTKDQEMMWRLADNKLNESDWDMSLVTEELKLLSPEMIDLSGFKRDIILQSAEDEYDIENGLKNEVRIEKGDVWKLGNHRLMCGDSTKKEDVERLMDGKKADMVFTDPPYGMRLDTDYSKLPGTSSKYDKVIGDDEDFDASILFQLVDSPIWYLWGADYYCFSIPKYREGSYIVWSKSQSEEENKVIGSRFEMCWVYPKQKKDVWFERSINQSSERLGEHPTQKPIALSVRALKKSSAAGASVLDLFGGSGSTLIACEQTNRKCYMMELDPKYCTVILDRWEKLTGKKAEKIWQDQL